MSVVQVVAYIFQADLWCPVCVVGATGGGSGVDAEGHLDRLASGRGVDRGDERTFDSDQFPKVVFGCQLEDGDRCGSCGEVL